MKTQRLKKSIALGAIALIICSGCAGGPDTRLCRFDDRATVGTRLLCYNLKTDYDSAGNLKPGRKMKETYISVPDLKALRGYLMVPPGKDETNLRECVRRLRNGQQNCS